ncbi:hypothetical protein LY76DRAFT_597594 [Colletotrichum caudatum]|nr:hypothetical protein LY76DRAFT_597594 [Colletotrichum caudatum]
MYTISFSIDYDRLDLVIIIATRNWLASISASIHFLSNPSITLEHNLNQAFFCRLSAFCDFRTASTPRSSSAGPPSPQAARSSGLFERSLFAPQILDAADDMHARLISRWTEFQRPFETVHDSPHDETLQGLVSDSNPRAAEVEVPPGQGRRNASPGRSRVKTGFLSAVCITGRA